MGLLRAAAIGQGFPNAVTAGAILPAADYDAVILDDNPAGFWDYDGTDLTGGGNSGTQSGTPTTSLMPNGDLAMTFNGSTQFYTIPTQPYFSPAGTANGGTTGIMTVEAWINPAVVVFPNQTGTGYVWWAGKGNVSGASGNQEWGCRMYGTGNTETPTRYNRISGYAFNPSGALGVGAYFQDPAAAPLTPGLWIYYCLVINTVNTTTTYPTGYVTIYRGSTNQAPLGLTNPNTQSLASDSIVPQYLPGTAAPVRIGTRASESFFEGSVGKFAIYNYQLSGTGTGSANQILTHYNAMYQFTSSLYTIAPGVATTAGSANAALGIGANGGWSWSGSAWSFSGGASTLASLNVGTYGITVNASNTQVQSCQVGGQITVAGTASVTGTTIYNCIVEPAAGGQAIQLGGTATATFANTTIRNCTLSGADAAANRLAYGILDAYGNAHGSGLVVQENEIYNCRTGMSLTGGAVQANYVHDMGFQAGDQVDCVLCTTTGTASSLAGGLTVTGNTLFNNLSGNSVISLGNASPGVQYVTISGNLLAGGSYSVYGGGTAAGNVVVTDNRFSEVYYAQGGQAGAVTSFGTATASNVWARNVVHDTGATIPP